MRSAQHSCLALGVTFTLICAVVSASGQEEARSSRNSGTQLSTSKSAVVQIIASKQIGAQTFTSTGTGFVIVPGDLVITALHVVTERHQSSPGATTSPDAFVFPNGVAVSYLPNIRVKLNGGKEVDAEPTAKISLIKASLLEDYCVLKLTNTKASRSLEFGQWNSLEDGDDLTAWGFPLGLPGPVLIKASVALKHERLIALEPQKPMTRVRTLIFQGPNNKGMSGGPIIHNRTGKVVGVVSTRLIGIGEELAKAREDIVQGRKVGSVKLTGFDPLKGILNLIDVLDQFLMSGMGSAIPVDPIVQELRSSKSSR